MRAVAFEAAFVSLLVFTNCGEGTAARPGVGASAPLRAGLADPGGPGPYAVGHTSFMLVDGAREQGSEFGGRRIFASVFYPVDAASVTDASAPALFPLDPFWGRWPVSSSPDWEAQGFPRTYEDVPASTEGPFPLVLFSTGAGSKYYLYLFLTERLASHGYVIAIVQPSRDGILRWDPSDPLAVMAWNRPRDVTFTLDALLARNETTGDLLAGLVDADLVVASGHSLGGLAALALAGGDDSVCDWFRANGIEDGGADFACGPALPDARIKAVLPIDGSSFTLSWSELTRVTVPAISISEEWGHMAALNPPELAATWARQHAAISAHPSYRVEVANADHLSFTNNCLSQEMLHTKGLVTLQQILNTRAQPWCSTDTPQLEVARLTAEYQLAFLATELRHTTGYQQILTPGWALTVESLVELFVTEPDGNPSGADCAGCFRFFPHQPGSETAVARRDDPFGAAAGQLLRAAED
jgi:predicted dienelactone hydrolase